MSLLFARGLTRAARAATPARLVTIALATALLLGTTAGIAAAHVTVNPDETEAGSWAKLTFRVPNESDTASTVAISVALPTDHPFPTVSVMPVPGWTVATTTATLDPPVTEGRFTLDEVTDSVTWTADDGAGIGPGEFLEFAISVGPVPAVASLVLPATQTYSDGTVVAWDQVAANGAAEPDHPAPVLTITEADHAAAPPDSLADRSTTTDATAQLMGAWGLAVAAVALVVAIIAVVRKRRA